MSESSAKRTNPYPREIPVEGSYMILADLVEGKRGVKSDTNSVSPTSLPKSPTKTLYSPSHLG